MSFHIALSRDINFDQFEHDASLGLCPRHIMVSIKKRLNARVHSPIKQKISLADKLLSKLSSRPEHWAIARKIAQEVGENDVIFCTGEDIGVPVAVMCARMSSRAKVVVYFHNIDRIKGKLTLMLFGLAKKIDIFMACSSYQTDFLKRYLNLPESKVFLLLDQTDTQFFNPGRVSADKKRPTLVSVGLEKRDYRLLAQATSDLDVDVKISGFSNDANALKKTFPDVMPENMSRRFYEWPDLLQLYRDADIVVISLVDNKYAAGVQVMMEAMACKRPVIISNTQGMVDYLRQTHALKVVKVGDVDCLRNAILELLSNPEEAKVQAEAGYNVVQNLHKSEVYEELLIERLSSL
ncbi:MAG: glycosyl transferase group 1 [Proteobacteria bacterium ST_bin12]|nr:MAG: glycosyl transferase group 1 [Proteobacteria bacterium ST_bin12]